VVADLRRGDGPAIVVFEIERLTHHTNADDERLYRPADEIAAVRGDADPIRVLSDRLLAGGVTRTEIDLLDAEVQQFVRTTADAALAAPNPDVNLDARAPLPAGFPGESKLQAAAGSRPMTMLEALRETLRRHLAVDARVTLFGEDIEDPKGDVFGLTRGLSTDFPGQVSNSALSESTILGVSIGRALAGGRPVAFIQFADFLPLAFNQIATELGSLWWRSAGGWTAPVIIMAPCGGYRPGLGPFHAQTFESTFAHVPGLDVVMPATAADAAGLLNAAFAGGRPTLFLYPKVLLNDASAALEGEVAGAFVPPGRARLVATGDQLTLVAWGATVALASRAAQALAAAGVPCDVLDLRSISPWDQEAVLRSVRRTGRLIVIHEDNLTCGFGAEVVATVAEKAGVPVQCRRITRPDTYVPCNYVNQLAVLPSLRRVLDAAGELCGIDVSWADPVAAGQGVFVLEAVGSSPADQNVTVLAWKVSEGAAIRAGDLLAECEADKATFDLRAPMGGRITDLREVGEQVRVGTPLARIHNDSQPVQPKRVPVEPRPTLRVRPQAAVLAVAPAVVTAAPRLSAIDLSGIAFVTGARCVTNEEIIRSFPGRKAGDITQRTGIEQRYFCGEGETALTLGIDAARKCLRARGLTLADLDAILVSTSTPVSLSPSLACRIHHALAQDGPSRDVPATDLLAACSGYLYALQAAFDFIGSEPAARVLVVTAEAMSHWVRPDEFDTAIVFGDAASATLVEAAGTGPGRAGTLRLSRPVLSARGEDGSILTHGRFEGATCHPVEMDGLKVFPIAVRRMPAMLDRACAAAGVAPTDLDWIVPHQANGRIITAVQKQTGLPAEKFINNVARYGNTSSSSIPVALAEMVADGRRGKVGMGAFGGGFTFAAAVGELF
jgi:2-oxoisovalerate dehydrogenase E1 component